VNGGGIYRRKGCSCSAIAFITNTAQNGEGGAITWSQHRRLLPLLMANMVEIMLGRQRRRDSHTRQYSCAFEPEVHENQEAAARQPTGGAIYGRWQRLHVRASQRRLKRQHGANGGVVLCHGRVFFNVHDTVNIRRRKTAAARSRSTKITYTAQTRRNAAGPKRRAAFSPSTVFSLEWCRVFKQNHANKNGGVAFANVVTVRDQLCFSTPATLAARLR